MKTSQYLFGLVIFALVFALKFLLCIGRKLCEESRRNKMRIRNVEESENNDVIDTIMRSSNNQKKVDVLPKYHEIFEENLPTYNQVMKNSQSY
ncbi:hypothetical protein PVAND_005377 [Polypedilum vanderplanki]|uniref:Uncharacterized protein n=1 Tax=Polypedilum vanderplanki TaxID=319348 RepID=A0A9J6BZZ9_POLVA|nr:hypothetical protein PVAND_005377 [Polypedilum vanderplanki]